MGTVEKLLEWMRRNPQGDWTMDNLLTIARKMGLEVRSCGGSHHVFSCPGIAGDVSVPYRRPIKAVYIKKIIALVDAADEKEKTK